MLRCFEGPQRVHPVFMRSSDACKSQIEMALLTLLTFTMEKFTNGTPLS